VHCTSTIAIVGYQLRGLIGRADVFAADPHHLRTVALQQQFALLPITNDVFDALGGGEDRPFAPIFHFMSRGIASLAEHLSARAPIAYCEADLFGGTGEQAVVVWNGSTVTLGPVAHEFEWNVPDPPREQWPINSALAALGAIQGEASDLFDAIGLSRHRWIEDWLDQS